MELSANLDPPTIGRSLELPVLAVNVIIMPERERVDEYRVNDADKDHFHWPPLFSSLASLASLARYLIKFLAHFHECSSVAAVKAQSKPSLASGLHVR